MFKTLTIHRFQCFHCIINPTLMILDNKFIIYSKGSQFNFDKGRNYDG